MAYRKGDLKLTYDTLRACTEGQHEYCTPSTCYESPEGASPKNLFDSRSKAPNSSMQHVVGAYLPHSCDEWYIGTQKELLNLLEDVVEALASPSLRFSPDGGDFGGPGLGSVQYRLEKAFPELLPIPSASSHVSELISGFLKNAWRKNPAP